MVNSLFFGQELCAIFSFMYLDTNMFGWPLYLFPWKMYILAFKLYDMMNWIVVYNIEKLTFTTQPFSKANLTSKIFWQKCGIWHCVALEWFLLQPSPANFYFAKSCNVYFQKKIYIIFAPLCQILLWILYYVRAIWQKIIFLTEEEIIPMQHKV